MHVGRIKHDNIDAVGTIGQTTTIKRSGLSITRRDVRGQKRESARIDIAPEVAFAVSYVCYDSSRREIKSADAFD
jgi:hypothetical protein